MQTPSPGVERAVAAAKLWAERFGAPEVRLVDYLLGLLDEEEGRPAVLLERLGYTVGELQATLQGIPVPGPSIPLSQLFSDARAWSLAHRADPTFMSDAFLLAVLQAEPAFWGAVPGFGGLAEALAKTLGGEDSPMAPAHEQPVFFEFSEEQPDLPAARILDANLNRSREALRVLEDYCRFVIEDRFLTAQTKQARHSLAEVAKQLAPKLLLAGRETLQDVGTTISAESEYRRRSPRDVAMVNLKRLQESLRSLEEYGKLFSPELGRELEAIRYRSYTLERALVTVDTAREMLHRGKLYVLLTHSQCVTGLEAVIEGAAAGGATIFQLREKALPDRQILLQARLVRELTKRLGVLFVMNDRPDIARLTEADGVHLGQDDLSVKAARQIVGSEAFIGVSTHSLAQVRQAILDGADYIGIGPTFPSKTKEFASFPGLALLQEAVAETSLPAFALGGIDPENVHQVAQAGCRRIAVSSCIAAAANPESVARSLLNALS